MKKLITFIVLLAVIGGTSAVWYFGTYVFEVDEQVVYAEEVKDVYYTADVEEVALNLFRGLEGINGLDLVESVVVSRSNSDNTHDYKMVDLAKFLEPGRERAEIFEFKDALRGWETNEGAVYDQETGEIELDQREQNIVFGKFVTKVNREDEGETLQNTISELVGIKMGKVGLMELAFTYSRSGDFEKRNETNKTLCTQYQERCESFNVNVSGKVTTPQSGVEVGLVLDVISHDVVDVLVGNDGTYSLSAAMKAYDHLVFVISNDKWTTGPIAMPVAATEESISNFNLSLSPK